MNRRRPAGILVTGGAGFIGVNFVRSRFEREPEARVVVLDALTYAGHRPSLDDLSARPGFKFVHGDIRDRELVQSLLRDDALDTIVHFAAESHVDRSIAGAEAFVDTNLVGTYCLLEAARAVWLRDGGAADRHHFHHVSTDEVYGSLDPDDSPFTEASPYLPNSPYAATKAGADHLVRAYSRTYGLRTTTSTCSNNYGPYQHPEKLVPLCIVNLLHGGELPIYGDGRNVRDWLHVLDHCSGIDLILERGRGGAAYNLGGDGERTNLDLVTEICQLLDRLFERSSELAERYPLAPPASGEPCASRITFVRDRPGHDRRYAIDAGRARRELGYRNRFQLRDGLEHTIRWYLENPDWWRDVMGPEYRAWIEGQYTSSGDRSSG